MKELGSQKDSHVRIGIQIRRQHIPVLSMTAIISLVNRVYLEIKID